MIELLNVVRFIFPFIALLLFFLLYRTSGNRMMKFYRIMVFRENGTKFFAMCLYLVLLFFNWCCYMCEPTLATLITGAFVFPLGIYRLSDIILHRLHENRVSFYITLLVVIICYAVPALNCAAVSMFLLALAAMFYPSRTAKQMKEDFYKHRQSIRKEDHPKIYSAIIKKYY